VINGVELYITYKKRNLHLLGYKIDINNARLHDVLRETQVKRKKLIERLVPKLKRVGLHLDISELFAQPSTYIGVANVVRALRHDPKNQAIFQKALNKKEYDFFEVYNKFFSATAPCYLPEVSLPAREAFDLIRRSRGIAVLSHPGWHLRFDDDHVITELKKLGLAGIECFSSHHNWDQTAHYMTIARREKLLATGGSDYHGDLPGDAIIENYYEYTSLPYDIYEKIKAF